MSEIWHSCGCYQVERLSNTKENVLPYKICYYSLQKREDISVFCEWWQHHTVLQNLNTWRNSYTSETKCEHFWQQWGWGAPLEWVDTKETTLTIHLQRILWNQWRPLERVDIKEITLTIQLLRFFYNINEGLLNG